MSTPYYSDDLVTLYHADYREGIDGLTADAIITDPPYGETSLAWDRWPNHWLADATAITSALWCFGSFRMFLDHADEFRAWKFSHEIVWEKHNGSGFAADKFRRVHELATLWYRGDWADLQHDVPRLEGAQPKVQRRKARPPHMGQIGNGTYLSDDGGERLMTTVQYVRSEHGRAVHPTQKPVGIVAPLIEYSVPVGGLVVDLFAGSGTTLLAARNLGRRATGFEVNEKYAETAAVRLSQQAFDLGALA